MLAFYLDHNVHRAIADGLRRHGIDVITASEDGLAEEADEQIFQRASDLGRVVVSFDPDFLEIAAQRQAMSIEFPGLAYAVQKSLDIGRAIEYLELIAILKSAEEMRNTVEFIPSK